MGMMKGKIESERQRISGILIDAVLTDEAVVKLSAYNENDLMRAMRLLGAYMKDECIKRVEACRTARVPVPEKETVRIQVISSSGLGSKGAGTISGKNDSN